MLSLLNPRTGARHPEKTPKTSRFDPLVPFLCFSPPANHCPPATYKFLTTSPHFSLPTLQHHLLLPNQPERTPLLWRIQRQGLQTPHFHSPKHHGTPRSAHIYVVFRLSLQVNH